jgi:hypothetical protein
MKKYELMTFIQCYINLAVHPKTVLSRLTVYWTFCFKEPAEHAPEIIWLVRRRTFCTCVTKFCESMQFHVTIATKCRALTMLQECKLRI